jgi:hypothetical protein
MNWDHGGRSPAVRQLPFDAEVPVDIQAFVVGGVAEEFLNSRHAATFLFRTPVESWNCRLIRKSSS